MQTQYPLPPGSTLTATVEDGAGHVRQVENPAIAGVVTNAAAAVYGPYLVPRHFNVTNNCAVVIAESDPVANIPTAEEKALIAAIPTSDQFDQSKIWNDGGILKVSTAGDPP